MTAPTARLGRLLSLLPYFQARPGISLDEAATDWGITAKQLRDDVLLLTYCGLPGYGPGELIDVDFDALDAGYVHITFDADLDRPLRLTAKEALALSVALQALADTPGVADTEVVARALAKIEAAAGGTVDGSTVAVSVDESVRFIPLLHRAVTDGRALSLHYYTATRDESGERVVDPLRVFEMDGRTYLQAWCRQAEGVRVFRADRIEDATLLEEPAQPPADLELPELTEGVYRPASDHLLATLRLAPRFSWVADYYPHESLEQDGNELRLTLRVADPAWLRSLVLGSGGGVGVLEPASLAAEIRDEARAALASYSA